MKKNVIAAKHSKTNASEKTHQNIQNNKTQCRVSLLYIGRLGKNQLDNDHYENEALLEASDRIFASLNR